MLSFIRLISLGLILAFSGLVNSAEVDGYLVQGGWAKVKTQPNSKIVFNGVEVVTDAKGLALIGFARDAKLQQSLQLITADSTKSYEFKLARQNYEVQKINGLPPKYVSPSPEAMKKIQQDRAKAVAARDINVPTPFFLDGFIWPTEGWITGVYGSQRVLNGEPRAPHLGVDIAEKAGTPVYAPAAGKITLAESMELSGNTLFIDHGYGLRSDFMHLDSIEVSEGDLVEKGQRLGTMGATGRATGPHLHWGMSWFQTRIDPSVVFELPETLKKGDRILNGEWLGKID